MPVSLLNILNVGGGGFFVGVMITVTEISSRDMQLRGVHDSLVADGATNSLVGFKAVIVFLRIDTRKKSE